MFYCQILGTLTQPGEKQNKITVKSRERAYTRTERDMETNRWVDVIEGYGHEIVKEISASDAGMQAWNDMSVSEREALVEAINSL